MIIGRNFLRFYVSLFGTLVLVSYYFGLEQTEYPELLWGGIPPSWRTVIIPWMFMAAIGFLIYQWKVLYDFDDEVTDTLHWPWSEPDDRGNLRLLLAFSLFLIPSALWLESTRFHLNNSYSWTPFLVITILGLVALGNFMFILLAYCAYKNQVSGSKLLLISSLMSSIQVIFNDFILWTIKFPW